jgi:methionyl-tRNA formyltransferase
LGWVNFHPSYLPEYRGPSPIEWQLIHGRKKGGCTAHFMASKYDTGPILLQERIEIDSDDNRETMQLKCGLVMGKLALGVIKLLNVNPNVKGLLQNEQYMSYAPHREIARYLNTNQTAENVRNQVRGLSPFPCAAIKFGLQTLSIGSVAITSQPSTKTNKPMFISPKGRLLIATTDFYLEILTVRYRKKIISDYFFLLEGL